MPDDLTQGHRGGRALLPLAVVLTAACGSGDVTYVTPPSPPSAEVVLQLSPDPADASFAQSLGWGQAIPGATVTIQPADSGAPARALSSSATGEVPLGALTAGDYLVRIQRVLSAGEMEKLPPAEEIEGWGAFARLRVTAGSREVPVSVQASRRRSLVISEWFFNDMVDRTGWMYSYGQYIELYNNADTTVYLDGMRLGQGFHSSYDFPNFPCSAYTEVTDDPTSVWAIDVEQFPGRGHDYPVAPGQVVLVAQDAIDHRVVAQGAPDLSHADFEQEASQDVDNPAVPNMISVGDRFPGYHGFILNPLANVIFLSLPVAPGDLTQGHTFGSVYTSDRYPARKLLDVATWVTNWTGNDYPPCPRIIHRALDREPARAFGSSNYDLEAQYSLQRVQLRPGSQPRFQHTRNSNADFIPGLRSPGLLSLP